MTAAKSNVSLLEILRQMGMDRDADFLRDGAQLLSQRLIELEATERIGADRYERTPERCTSRNGYRDRTWETRVGKLELRIPKVREGAFFPSFLEPRKMAEKAILSVVQEACVHGVSTHKVDSLVRRWAWTASTRAVSRIARELDEEVNLFSTDRLRALPVCMAGCHLPEGEERSPCRKQGLSDSSGRQDDGRA